MPLIVDLQISFIGKKVEHTSQEDMHWTGIPKSNTVYHNIIHQQTNHQSFFVQSSIHKSTTH